MERCGDRGGMSGTVDSTVDSMGSPGSLLGDGARAGKKSDSCPFSCAPLQLKESEGDTYAGIWGGEGGGERRASE